jgi:Lar family restriction alleviation protein
MLRLACRTGIRQGKPILIPRRFFNAIPKSFMKKLLSCPFCGSAAEIVDETLPLTHHHQYSISADHACGCLFNSVDMPLFATKAEAIRKWNQRAEMQPLSRLKSA